MRCRGRSIAPVFVAAASIDGNRFLLRTINSRNILERTTGYRWRYNMGNDEHTLFSILKHRQILTGRFHAYHHTQSTSRVYLPLLRGFVCVFTLTCLRFLSEGPGDGIVLEPGGSLSLWRALTDGPQLSSQLSC